MCAACLRHAARATSAPSGRLRRMAAAGLTLAGVVLAWAVYFGAAQGLITVSERSERMAWQDR